MDGSLRLVRFFARRCYLFQLKVAGGELAKGQIDEECDRRFFDP